MPHLLVGSKAIRRNSLLTMLLHSLVLDVTLMEGGSLAASALVMKSPQGPDAPFTGPESKPSRWGTSGTIPSIHQQLPSYRRHLTDQNNYDEPLAASHDVEPKLTTVTTGAELSSALMDSSTNIELQNHIYLPYTLDVSSLEILRGNCAGAADVAEVLDLPTDSAPLRTMSPRHCVIMLAQDSIDLQNSPNVWIDGVYFRKQYSRSLTGLEFPVLQVGKYTNLWMTDVIIQGSGRRIAECEVCGLHIYGSVYAEGCLFAEMGGTSVFQVEDARGSLSMKNSAVEGNTLVDSTFGGSVVQALGSSDLGSIVRLQSVDFTKNTEDKPLLQQVVKSVPGSSRDVKSRCYSNIEREVALLHALIPGSSVEAGTSILTLPLAAAAQLPTGSFLTLEDDSLKDLQQRAVAEGGMAIMPPPTQVGSSVAPHSVSGGDSAVESNAATVPSESISGPPGSQSSRNLFTSAPFMAGVAAAAALVIIASVVTARYASRLRCHRRDVTTPPEQLLGSAAESSVSAGSNHGSVSLAEQSGVQAPEFNAQIASPVPSEALNAGNTLYSQQPVQPPSESLPESYDTVDNATTYVGSSSRSTWISHTQPPTLHPPTDAAHRLDNICRILDGFGARKLFCEDFEFLGPGHRKQGGQGVVQFGYRKGGVKQEPIATKFFLNLSDYHEETAFYQKNLHALHGFMPKIFLMHDNTDGAVTDPFGNVLPPFIVMEKGDPLPTLASQVDIMACTQLLSNVARRIEKLHKAGFAHRDLKPGNIMMLPHRMCWVLIDFGISAPIGEDAPLQFTLHYAAPETAAAFCADRRTVTATAEVDAWALGVIAYEVLLGKQPFALKSETEVLNQLKDPDALLPWDDTCISECDKERLGRFLAPMRKLLARNPQERAAVRSVRQELENYLTERSAVYVSQGMSIPS